MEFVSGHVALACSQTHARLARMNGIFVKLISHHPFSLDDEGRITVPTGAGLGVELNDEFRK